MDNIICQIGLNNILAKIIVIQKILSMLVTPMLLDVITERMYSMDVNSKYNVAYAVI